jgi:UDP-GlcNAc:undecaprenyl-phosphate GlcNAc-1-phosphate transferase
LTALSLLAPALVAALFAFALTPLVSRFAILVGAVDMPGRRKVHSRPIPRLGGLAVVLSIAAVWVGSTMILGPVLPPELSRGLSLGVVPLLVISAIDDIRGVRAWHKLLAHIVAASVAVTFGVSLGSEVHLFGAIHLGALAAPLSILWLVGVTNAFNLIDGLDGLSAGLALIAAVSMAAVFGLVDQPAMAGAALVLAGGLAGFLPYNLHPARSFLGDTGATAIGFCLGAFALKGGSTLSSGLAALVPVFIMGLPIADTLIAMARRAVRRFERRRGGLFDSDRNHIHHRLLALGIDHGRAVLVLYCAGAALAAAAFGSMFLKAQDAALVIVALLVAGFVGVHRLDYDEFAFIRRGTVLRVYDTAVVHRSMFVVFVDLAISAISAYVALGLKLDTWTFPEAGAMLADLTVTFAPVTALVFWYAGMYRGGWRVANVTDLAHACGAAVAATVLGAVLHQVLSATPQPPAVFLIYGLVNMVLVTTSRGSYVVLLNSQQRARNQGAPVLLYGAGRHGIAAASELFDDPDAGLRPIGFIDDDPSRKGRRVRGLPVLGTLRDLDKLIEQHGVKAVLLTTPQIEESRVAETAAACERLGIQLMRLRMLVDQLVDDSAQSSGVAVAVAPANALRDEPPGTPGYASPADAPPCGRCGGPNVRRSKVRGAYERFRKLRTPTRPFRCHDCGWRGWRLPLERVTPLGDLHGTGFDIPDIPLQQLAVRVDRPPRATRIG